MAPIVHLFFTGYTHVSLYIYTYIQHEFEILDLERILGSLFCQQDLFRMKSKLFLLPGFWMGTEIPLGMLQDSSHHQDDHIFRLGDPNLHLYFPRSIPKVPGNLTFPGILTNSHDFGLRRLWVNGFIISPPCRPQWHQSDWPPWAHPDTRYGGRNPAITK